MIAKYICSYCGEEYDNIEDCRAHEDRCADTFKDELWIFVKDVGGMDGRTFIEKGLSFDDILIIRNNGANAFFLLSQMMDEKGYIDPVDATNGMIRSGYYYWSDYGQFWHYTKNFDDTITRIVNTGTDIEDD